MLIYMGERLHNVKNGTYALVIATKETGLEVNSDERKYMVMALYQNGGWRHNIKIHNTSFERGEDFKRLKTTEKKRNSIQEKRSKSFSAESYVVQIANKQYKD